MSRTPADDKHPVRPGCEPWSAPGGPHGALVLHGFTGTPISMRPVAEALAEAGFAVELPRLPGHGTEVEDLLPTTFQDWLAEAERALGEVRARVPGGRVVVVGLSMGGALTVALAERHRDLAGIVLVNTPVAVPQEMVELVEQMIAGGLEVMDSIGNDIAAPDVDEGSYDQTPLRPLLSLVQAGPELRAGLRDVTCPALVVTSRQDHVVDPRDSDILAEELGGPVERLWLEKSYHVATLDHDADVVRDAVVAFARRATAG